MPSVDREDLQRLQALVVLGQSREIGVAERKEATELLGAHRWRMAEKDPWWFIRQFCVTIDEHDSRSPYKRFPNHEYLRLIVRDWEEWSERMPYWLPKSRQMMVSWLMVGLHLWMFMTREAQLIFFQSKKEEDACRLVDRAWFMYQRMPEEVRGRVKAEKMSGKIVSAERNSMIWGIPQGADQIRSNVPSAVFSDEMAFQEDAEKSYVASLPAIEGGGRYTAVSSAAPGFFFYMVEDGSDDLLRTMSY
jgi:hypothetical protein